MASDDPIHGFQNSAPDYADDYPMLGEINNVFSESLAAVLVHDRPSRRTGITVKIVIYHFWVGIYDRERPRIARHGNAEGIAWKRVFHFQKTLCSRLILT